MSESTNAPDQKTPLSSTPQFGEEMYIEEAGFAFRPIAGFKLEVDGSVYMYSEDGNLEICMIGGKMDKKTSLAELNDELAADFMVNFDEFELSEAGKDTVQGITGLMNDIRFTNAEEEGLGRALICSPHFNRFFFILVIASAQRWVDQGQEIFSTAKSFIHFNPQTKPDTISNEDDQYPDLTIEAFESIVPDEDLIVTVIRGDISLLLAARTAITQDEITLTEILAPGDQWLYQYDPESGGFSSQIFSHPIVSNHGEICLLLPFANQQALQIGNYRFKFATKHGMPLQNIQVIIRHGQALALQKVDLNLWLALEDEGFDDPVFLAEFAANLRSALAAQLAPMNLAPGEIEWYHPAPDELTTFACINLDTDLADCSYMIAESVDNGRALNVGLVDRFTRGDPPIDAETLAVSSGSPGMILSPVSPHACILVNYSACKGDDASLAQAIIEQLVNFCSVHPLNTPPDQPQAMIPDLIWRLRRHPIFYDAD